MSLHVKLTQQIDVQQVVGIARAACDTILRVYTAEVRCRITQSACTQSFTCGAPAIADGSACGPHALQADSWDVQHKADDSPLTRADKEANAVICAGLARIGEGGARCTQLIHVLSNVPVLSTRTRAAPHIPIVSEENRRVGYDTRVAYQYSWCVDPLDGTKEFLKRNGQFTVNIALLEQDRPVLGVVAVPVDVRRLRADSPLGWRKLRAM